MRGEGITISITVLAIASMMIACSPPTISEPIASKQRSAPVAVPPAENAKLLNVFNSTGVLPKLNQTIEELIPRAKASRPISDHGMGMVVRPPDPVAELQKALVQRALLYEKCGKLDLAEADFAQALGYKAQQTDPAAARSVVLLARAGFYERAGNLPKALADLNQTISEYKDVGLEMYRAQFYERIGQFDSAKRDWDKLAELSKYTYGVPLAQFCERHGDTARARELFDWNIEQGGAHKDQAARGEFLERQGKFEDAAEDYAETHEEPGFFERRGDLKRAADCWDELVARLATMPGGGDNSGVIGRAPFYERQGRFDDSLKDLQQIKQSSNAMLTRIRVLKKLNQSTQAKSAATAFLEPGYRFDYFDEDMKAQTESGCGDKRRIFPTDQRAQVLIALGRPEEALAELSTTDPDDYPGAQFDLAVALEKIECKQLAVKWYQRCIEFCTLGNADKYSINRALLASAASKRLTQLGIVNKYQPQPFVKDTKFEPLALMDLKS